jgi:hypothetical protein
MMRMMPTLLPLPRIAADQTSIDNLMPPKGEHKKACAVEGGLGSRLSKGIVAPTKAATEANPRARRARQNRHLKTERKM